MHVDCSTQFNEIVASARRVSTEIAEAVEAVLRAGLDNPLPPAEARRLLVRVVEVMRTRADARGAGSAGLGILDEDIEDLVRQATEAQEHVEAAVTRPALQLVPHNGIDPHPVLPSPVFHERQVQVRAGFVRTRDIRLWDENVRLDIHLAQFRAREGREPEDDELLDIMLGRAGLEGVTENDQFKIRGLARSIAVNGVRKPPIIDTDGTLLDGNRRVTACHYILNNDEFKSSEKARAEWLLVWQLTEYATEVDREAVVVSLNFEEDHKEEWPKYVKAQKVYQEWQEMLVLEPRSPPPAARSRALRQELARKFALATDDVSKYIEMVKLAQDFEDHQAGDRGRDPHAVKHRAAKAFEYFDELGKGRSPGGVNHALNQDDTFKHLVYDLLYDGKFKNWNKIRDLKYVYGNDAATDLLRRARDSGDADEAEDLVEQACAHARDVRREQREVGVNARIKAFCDWFDGVPVGVFGPGHKNSITPGNLRRLHDVLAHVEGYLQPAPEENAFSRDEVPDAA